METPAAPASSEEEFKITDMAGHTMVTSQDQVKAEAPPPRPAPPPPLADDPADVLFDVRTLGPGELARLRKIQANQEKSALVLRAILELLEERGYLTRAEVDARTA